MAEAKIRTPSSGRDAAWLVGADLLAVALAFVGQILLAHALLAEHYGWMVLAIDLYASLFLIIDLGLPTLIARDGTRAPELVPLVVWRSYRWQALVAVPFLLLALLARPEQWLNVRSCGVVGFGRPCCACSCRILRSEVGPQGLGRSPS